MDPQREPAPDLSTPEGILHAPQLTRDQKIEKLRQMAYDARELDVASDEGMTSPSGASTSLGRIQRALLELGVEAEGTDAKQ